MLRLSEFVAFDLETTGLSQENDHLLEIGAVHFRQGEIVNRFSQLVKPPVTLSLLVKHLTGITDLEVVEAGSPLTALQAFADFVGDLPLVAHNAEFDAGFLSAHRQKAGLPPIINAVFDSLLVARMAWPEAPNHRLETLVQFLELSDAKAHRALPDAEKSGELWLRAEKVIAGWTEPLASQIDRLLSLAPKPWNILAEGLSSSPVLNDWGASLNQHARSPLVLQTHDLSEQGAVAAAAAQAGLPQGAWPKKSGPDVVRALVEGRWLALETDNAVAPWLGMGGVVEAMVSGQGRYLVVVPDKRSEEILLQTVLPAFAGGRGNLEGASPQQDVTSKRLVSASASHLPDVCLLREPEAYLSPQRLLGLLAHPLERLVPSEILQIMPLLCWANKTTSGDLTTYPGISADRGRPIWMKVAAEGFAAEEVFAARALKQAQAARIIITRMETFLKDLNLDGSFIPACEGVVVFDAHRLPEAAEVEWGREFHFFRIRHGLQLIAASREKGEGLSAWARLLLAEGQIPEASRPWAEGLTELAFEAEKAVQKWLARIGRQAEKLVKPGENRARYRERIAQTFSSPETEALAAFDKVNESLSNLASACEALAPSFALECRRVSGRLQQMRILMAHVSEPRENEVAWAEDFLNPHRIRLRTRPLDIGSLWVEKLAALHRGGVLLSAVFSLGDDSAKYFLKRAGLSELPSRVRYQSESYAGLDRHCLVMPFAPVMNNAEAARSLGAILAKSLAEIPLPTVVIFPGTSHLKAVREELVKALPSDRGVIVQGQDGNRDNLAFLFRSLKAPILLTAEVQAGLLDSMGMPPQIVVITRLPFAAPSDPQIAARSEALQTEGKQALFELLVPEATQKVKEGLALLATPGVKQSIWMMDPRISREKYGQFVVKAVSRQYAHLSQPSEIANAAKAWLLPSLG